ncbi:hypothetical protein [Trichloromonas sp.]|uniref:hypothetical protein n=1 Tax=Trichloromonas sp. TaxID=3069249 RepID=UPI002A434DAD|nr:invasin domain 3-containing protein [Trichloromonas sp.]
MLDVNGNPMADGTLVNFEVNNSSLGSIVPNATVSGGNGEAQATFSASSENVGSATVKATCGNVSQSIIIDIAASPSGSIEFSSAEPQVIVIKGSGGVETSLIKFLVKDVNGQPVLGSQSVQLKLSGPNGGEYIGSSPGTTILEVGTVDGVVSAYLHSGTVPGTVTILATVVGTNISTSSGVIAIGGGIPSAAHFSLSQSKFNIEGLSYDGITAEINVRLADRYGNYNVLNGTAVSFYSECGAIDRSVNLNDEGEGSVTFRTQRPTPQNLAITPDLKDLYLTKLGVQLGNNNNPLNGYCSIIAVVDGEEKFIDSNGSGYYDFGETYEDSYDDVHLDKDDDPFDIPFGSVVDNYPHDPAFEPLIIDVNNNGFFDGMNNQWDASKKIVGNVNFLYTGRPIVSVGDGAGKSYVHGEHIVIPEGSNKRLYFSVHDQYFNPPIAGTNFSVEEDLGTIELTGNTSYEFFDSAVPGAPIFYVDLVNPPESPGTTSSPTNGSLTISVDWRGEEINFSLSIEGPNP